MYKLSLFIGTFFLTLSNSRLIFQNRRENYGSPNMLESNILKMETDLSAASHIAEILTANRNNKLKVFYFVLLYPLPCLLPKMKPNALNFKIFKFPEFWSFWWGSEGWACGEEHSWRWNSEYYESPWHPQGEAAQTNRKKQVQEAGKRQYKLMTSSGDDGFHFKDVGQSNPFESGNLVSIG